ncbi:MAG: class II aldolase/adducin family protein [Pseudomonadota bacterium]
MTTRPELLTREFRALSGRLGKDPLQVQGPGGNTSVKDHDVMWIKASGTELADAENRDIFVAVDRQAALEEANGISGDGSCKSTVIDKSVSLRPSIETTFHAALEHAVVAHTHSVATLVHAISPEGREACRQKLNGLPFAMVPYAKPGLPLTREILARIQKETCVVILQNHGLVCCGKTVDEVSDLIKEVEERLSMSPKTYSVSIPEEDPPSGFKWSEKGWLAQEPRTKELILEGSYYPDHVVFLGPALPRNDHEGQPAALMFEDQGIAIRNNATPAQSAMLDCLSDVFSRLPPNWSVEAIGIEAEAALLNWDAEKYRQTLAAR